MKLTDITNRLRLRQYKKVAIVNEPYVAPDIFPNLFAYYPFDNNGVDSLDSGMNFTVDVDLNYVAGKSGNAIDFVGTNNDKCSLSHASLNDRLNISDATQDYPISISFYIKFHALGDQWIISRRNTTNSCWQLRYYLGNLGLVLFSQGSNGASYIRCGMDFTPTLEQWYHITFTYDGSSLASGIKMYLDGVDVGTSFLTGTYVKCHIPTASTNVDLGDPEWSSSFVLNGSIDGLGFWDKELSQEEVTAIYNIQSNGGDLQGYDADAKKFIDAVSTLTTAQEVIIDNLVKGLKVNGTWSKYKAIYPFIGGTASAHKWNLKDPYDLDVAFRLSFNGAITHDANGIQGDGSTGYVNTFFIPINELTLNSETLTVYSVSNETPITSDPLEIGSLRTVTQASLMTIKGDATYDKFQSRLNADLIATSNIDARGYFIVSKNGNTTLRLFKDGVIKTSGISEGSLSDLENFILVVNVGGSPYNSSYSNQKLALITMGGGLTDTEVLYDSVLIQEYQDALGRAVSIGTEIYSWSDAGSKSNESDTVVTHDGTGNGWENIQGITLTSTDEDSYNGTYSVKLASINVGASDLGYLSWQGTIGKKYLISFWAKANNDNDSRLRAIFGFVEDAVLDDYFTLEWKKYVYLVEANATYCGLNIYTTRNGVTTLNHLYIDNVSIIELD